MISFINPATWGARITSVLGDPRPYGAHEGVDLAPTGTGRAVVAAADGTVIFAGDDPDGYGYHVKLAHADGFQTIYGHFANAPLVVKGEKVTAGQHIGDAGSTGYSTGTHLHFSIIKGGEYLNPLDFINAGVPSVVGRVTEAITDIRDFLGGIAQQVGADCEEPPDGADESAMLAWAACVKADLTPDQAAEIDARVEEWKTREKSGIGIGIPSAGEIAGEITDNINRAIIIPLKRSIADGVTWPLRASINAMKLSDTPLKAGADTIAWLQQPENQRLYLASQVALILIVLLFLFAARQFLSDSAKTVIKTAADPAGAGLEAALG